LQCDVSGKGGKERSDGDRKEKKTMKNKKGGGKERKKKEGKPWQ